MSLTWKQFSKITFPAYPLPNDNWYSADGLLFVDGMLVDDKNQPGKTLGIRRMQTSFKDLLPLKKAAETLLSIIKQPAGSYIDSTGKCFTYEKTKYCVLKYYKIHRIDKKGVASVLRLKGVKFPFTIPRPPPPTMNWAGVLHLDSYPWLLYNYAPEKYKDTRRKI